MSKIADNLLIVALVVAISLIGYRGWVEYKYYNTISILNEILEDIDEDSNRRKGLPPGSPAQV